MNDGPKICVLIPAYNEERVIEGTISALRQAGFNRSDLYVVNDLSTDGTAEIAANAGANVFTVPVNGGKARGQVAALEHFKLTDRYDWVVFLDADTKVDSQFLNVMYTAAEESPSVALFVGQVTSAKNNHVYSALRAYEYTFSHDVSKKGQDNFNVVYVAPGCTSMYNARVLKTLHIDHSTLAEDMDLTLQVHHQGGEVRYVHDAIVITQDPNSLSDYTKQVMRWYRGFWQAVKKHKVFAFTRKKAVDVYMMYIAIDALIFNRFFILAAGLLLFPLKLVGLAMFFDFVVFAGVGIYAAVRTSRLDVLSKMPVFYWISFINLYAFLKSFVEIVLCRKDILVWNKVQRYKFDSLTTTV